MKNKIINDKSINTINTNAINKIERKKFFIYSGAAAFGIFSLLSNPLKIFSKKPTEKDNSIKITQNPNAVKRKPREFSNG